MENQMKTAVENTNEHQVSSLTPMTGGDDVRTQAPERASESIMANIKNRAATKYLALTLLATTPAAMTSCDTTEVVQPTLSETEKYTPDEWLAKTGIKAEDTPAEGKGAITMLNTPVKGADGLYYIKPDIRLNKDVIKTLGEKVVQTSGRSKEDMHVYINFQETGKPISTQQGFEKSYVDVINHEGELRASQLDSNPYVTGKDMEKLYRPGATYTVTIAVRVRGDISETLKEQGLLTAQNQNNFSDSSVFFYNL